MLGAIFDKIDSVMLHPARCSWQHHVPCIQFRNKITSFWEVLKYPRGWDFQVSNPQLVVVVRNPTVPTLLYQPSS